MTVASLEVRQPNKFVNLRDLFLFAEFVTTTIPTAGIALSHLVQGFCLNRRHLWHKDSGVEKQKNSRTRTYLIAKNFWKKDQHILQGPDFTIEGGHILANRWMGEKHADYQHHTNMTGPEWGQHTQVIYTAGPRQPCQTLALCVSWDGIRKHVIRFGREFPIFKHIPRISRSSPRSPS